MKIKSLMNKVIVAVLGTCLVLSQTPELATATENYRYHNLVTEASQQALGQGLTARGVRPDAWQPLVDYIQRFNQEAPADTPLASDWTSAEIGEDANDFVTFMDPKTYEERQGAYTNDLNCRRAAFLLIHDLIKAPDELAKLGLSEDAEFTDLKARHQELTDRDQQLYSLLYPAGVSYQSTDDLIQAWHEAGLQFPSQLKLVSAVQNVDGAVTHFHAAVAYEKEGKVYLFEKIDPTVPYRLSEFASWADVKAHWLAHRFQVFADDIDILVNDQKIEDYIG